MVTLPSLAWFSSNTITNDNKAQLYKLACEDKQKSSSSWNISNLYNCQTKTMFIPYQLWTGMDWDGDKDADCMHQADSYFDVNDNSSTTIRGTNKWTNPKTNNELEVWFREKVSGSKQQYFACHDKGIGRVYDSRRGGKYYKTGRCKFPAGYGWQIGKQRKCKSTAIEIIKVDLNSDNDLSAIEFKWWYKSRKHNKYIHDHTYRYEVGYGSRKCLETVIF